MRNIITSSLAILFLGSLSAASTGCLVHSTSSKPAARSSAKCAPAHHWENGRCVHNGGGVGNGKGQGGKKK